MEWVVKFTGVTDVAAFASSYEHVKVAHEEACPGVHPCRPEGIATRFMQNSQDPTTVLCLITYKDEAQREAVTACAPRESLHFGPGGLSEHYATREPIGYFTDFWSGDGHF